MSRSALPVRARAIVSAMSVLAFLGSKPASAQSPDGTKPEDVSEIVVTGSRIRGVAPVGAPVISLGRDELAQSSATTVADFLKETPQVVGIGIDETRFASTGINASNASRATAINLRGLSPAATLVLLDGHRVTQSGTAGAFVDSSAIPSLAVQRLEVVADGASALYGSDAIAGVVNILVRKDFTGAETSIRDTFADGYSRLQLGQLFGYNWGSGHGMFAYEYSKNDALNSSEREFYRANQTARGGSDFRGQNCNPGTLRIGTTTYAIPATAANTSPSAAALAAGTRNLCDNSYTDIIPDQNRHSAVLYLSQDLNDWLSVSFEGYYSMKKLEASFAAQGSATTSTALNVPANNLYFVRPAGTTAAEQVDYSFFSQVGPLSAKGESENYSGILETQVKLPADWRMQAGVSGGQNWDYTFSRAIDTAALTTALGNQVAADALNPYGLGTSQTTLDKIFSGQFSPAGRNKMVGGEIRADGSLFEIPGGAIRMALGGEYRRYVLEPITTRGTVSAPLVTFDPPAPRKVTSGYVELYVPLVGADNARTGIQRLELSLAGRIDHYNDFGNTTNPKIGLTWTPSNSLTAKASYGTSFRAPALSDLKAPGAAVLATTEVDPTLSPPGTAARGLTIRAGNPNLGPEESRTWTAGINWHPVFWEGYELDLNYFDIQYDNQIASIFGGALQQEALYAAVIIRNPTPAQIAAALAQFPLSGVMPNPVAYLIDSRPQNRGATEASGVDFQTTYRWSTDGAGNFRVNLNGTWFTKYDTQQTPTAPLLDRVNVLGNPLKLRGRATFGWNMHALSASTSLVYANSYTDLGTTPNRSVDAYTTVDLTLGYDFGTDSGARWRDGVRLNLNATNLLDDDPPFVNSTVGYDPSQASPYGRLIGATLTKSW